MRYAIASLCGVYVEQETVDKYFEDTNFLDLDLLSTWGITDSDINYIKEKGFIGEPSYQIDAIVEGETEEVARVISFDSTAKMNKPILLDGRFPEKDNECVQTGCGDSSLPQSVCHALSAEI